MATPLHRALVEATGAVLAERLRVADTHWTRFRGLIGTASLPAGDGLWILPCRQVHMFWMRYAIDVVFVDAELTVAAVTSALRPWRISPLVKSATSVLELPAGTCAAAGVTVGQRLTIEARSPSAR